MWWRTRSSTVLKPAWTTSSPTSRSYLYRTSASHLEFSFSTQYFYYINSLYLVFIIFRTYNILKITCVKIDIAKTKNIMYNFVYFFSWLYLNKLSTSLCAATVCKHSIKHEVLHSPPLLYAALLLLLLLLLSWSILSGEMKSNLAWIHKYWGVPKNVVFLSLIHLLTWQKILKRVNHENISHYKFLAIFSASNSIPLLCYSLS
jgi:hypothetical protein